MTQDAKYWTKRPKDDKEKDWTYGEDTWLEGYTLSVEHPHRQLIIDALQDVYWDSLLEIGCNTGPNLVRINRTFVSKDLVGIDVSNDAIKIAKSVLPEAKFKVANYTKIPFPDQSFDVVLADATLLYASPETISKAMFEIDRVAKHAVILVERHAESVSGEVVGHVWGRNYSILLEALGFNVKEKKITEKEWPNSENWAKHGRLYISVRQ